MGDFHFQAPGARRLLDQIELAAQSATEGLGVFAFASAGGVERFMKAIQLGGKWKPPKKFHMIVGVDAVTNADALLKLADYVAASSGALSAEVFFHENPWSTFHPKFAIFKSPAGLRFLTGSGNLTTRGLGEASVASIPPGNWEAFGIQDFQGKQAVTHWNDARQWIKSERIANRLRPLDDEAVRTQAMANGLLRFAPSKPPGAVPGTKTPGAPKKSSAGGATATPASGKWSSTTTPTPGKPAGKSAPPTTGPSSKPVATITPLDEAETGDDLLVKELSKNRPGQADVGKGNLEGFFGYVAGKSTTVLVQYVSVADVVEPTQNKNLFENASSNYRVELSALPGFGYDIAPDGGRLIIVVARLAPRSFRYTVVPVTSPQYGTVSALLGPVKKSKGRKMRGKTFPLTDLPKLWPSAPSNLMPVLAHGPTP